MQGLLWAINQMGESLMRAEQRMAILQAENDQLKALLEEKGVKQDDDTTEPSGPSL